MSLTWAIVIVVAVSYLIGSINISKILSLFGFHKDIEKEGSGNPGTMNMLRTFGMKAALLTLLFEVVKAGLTAWLCAYITKGYGYRELFFFISGLSIVLGSCFPFFGTVRGGKGVACAFGVYCFSSMWYVALAFFVIGLILIALTEYGFISSLVFIVGISIATTLFVFLSHAPYAWIICILVWLICILILAKHHKNFYRLFTHQENKANFKEALKKMFRKKKKGVEEIPENEVENSPEKEIVVEEKIDKKEDN